jgi:2-C-methyl-D-erythritol 2,4-cyclodiphosphate synthase
LCHAIADAILGAAGAGDIGKHFPPGEEKWKNASSLDLIAETVNLAGNMGFEIINVDAVLIMESPKIAEYRDRMIANIADAMAVDPLRVSVKATTTEGMGFAGTGEGAAAQAIALLRERE